MRVWVNSKEAREIRQWAVEAGWLEVADRFYRAQQAGDSFSKPPFLWRWRGRHPVLLQCLYCERLEGFKSHRAAKKYGWVWWPQDRVVAKALTPSEGDEPQLVTGGWIHAECVEEWEKHAADITKARNEARRRRDAHDFFFHQPELLETHRGVLVRFSPAREHTFYGLLDDMEAGISADFGMERIRKVLDEMPSRLRENLVVVGFTGFYHRYHLLLGWAEAVPSEYDGVELDDIACSSVVVEEAPKRIRDRLPEHLRRKL